ncbi:MAG: nucleotidyltransferase domain-containing protein [Pirellulales bacterium]
MAKTRTKTRYVRELGVVRRWVGNSENWLNSFLELVPSTPNVISVVVMGSAVRARGHRRSDLDLLILYRGKRPSFDAPLEVDIRAYPVDSVEDKLARGHEIIGWAVKFGTALHDRERLWHNLQSSWVERVPLPSAAEAAERGYKSLSSAQEMLDAGDDTAAEDLVLAALTQFVRAKLIENRVFPASRPELPSQLRSISENDSLAQLLEDAMYSDNSASDLINELKDIARPIT